MLWPQAYQICINISCKYYNFYLGIHPKWSKFEEKSLNLNRKPILKGSVLKNKTKIQLFFSCSIKSNWVLILKVSDISVISFSKYFFSKYLIYILTFVYKSKKFLSTIVTIIWHFFDRFYKLSLVIK